MSNFDEDIKLKLILQTESTNKMAFISSLSKQCYIHKGAQIIANCKKCYFIMVDMFKAFQLNLADFAPLFSEWFY
jgi:hypothetical protein